MIHLISKMKKKTNVDRLNSFQINLTHIHHFLHRNDDLQSDEIRIKYIFQTPCLRLSLTIKTLSLL